MIIKNNAWQGSLFFKRMYPLHLKLQTCNFKCLLFAMRVFKEKIAILPLNKGRKLSLRPLCDRDTAHLGFKKFAVSRWNGIAKSFIFIFIFTLNACSTTTTHRYRYPLRHDKPPSFRVNANEIPNAVPKAEPLSKRGNPKSYVVLGHRYYVLKSAKGYHARGIASWYGMKFHRFQTANGEYYNVVAMTAAHKTLPLPTYLQVTNLRNGKKIIVKVNDRGPFVSNRLIDLSYAAAKKLDMTSTGTAPVEIRAITPGLTRLASNTSPISSSSTARNKTYVHLGIFKQHKQAQNLAVMVKQWTRSPVRVEKKPIHKRLYYQVVVGPLPNAQTSQKLRHQLQLAGLN